MHHKRLPWGNVIFDRGMEAQRGIVRAFLASRLASCGRFGEWDYLCRNHSLLSGYRALYPAPPGDEPG
jgi:protoporphyrinogen oxidase